MIRLDKAAWPGAYERYRHSSAFFPLIGAVLLGQQDGTVLADHPMTPRAVYVEHAFGFAQVIGEIDAQFEEALRRYLVVERSFTAAKVRLYTPVEPTFLRDSAFVLERSQRQRFFLSADCPSRFNPGPMLAAEGIEMATVAPKNVGIIEECFGVVRRFWRSDEDFCASALAVVARVDSRPVAICYAAAIADGLAEIDVLTQPAYREHGLGKRVVGAFCTACTDHGLRPVWDCFTNNAGSMALAASCGFAAGQPAYSFYTLSK